MALRNTFAALGALALLGACNGATPAPGGEAAAGAPAPMDTASATIAPEAPQAIPGVPPLPADPLAVGSQSAKDDLYCSALIYIENPDVSDALAPVDEALLRKAQMLGFLVGESGINKMVTEKAAHATHARFISDAYMAQVEQDMHAKKLRISLDDCNKRAAALPVQ